MNIPERVQLALRVRELIEMLAKDESDEFLLKLKDELNSRFAPMSAQYVEDKELTAHQAHIFEQVEMPFGIYKGTKIVDLDYEYLCRLFDPSQFMKKLKLYLQYCSKHRYRS